MNQNRASKKQQELLQFVDGFIKGSGYGPSYREIMRALGYKSVSTVAVHIDGLIAKGYLRRADKSARSLEVVTMREPSESPRGDSSSKNNLIEQLKARLSSKQLSADELQQIRDVLRLIDIDLDLDDETLDATDDKEAGLV